jgi:peroxiredoxin
LFTGCSTPKGKCPELGLITNVEKPENVITIDNRIGCSIPDFTWDTIDCKTLKPVAGNTQSLQDFKGRPVMVIFHKSMNCPGCKAQMPFIKAAYEQRTNKDLTVLTVYRGDGVSDVKRFVINQGYTFTAIADLRRLDLSRVKMR